MHHFAFVAKLLKLRGASTTSLSVARELGEGDPPQGVNKNSE